MQTTITVVTINVPVFLDGLCKNIERYGHKRDVDILVSGCYLTPPIEEFCQSLETKYSIPIQCFREDGLKKAIPDKEIQRIIPDDHPDRTIILGLSSYIRGVERVIALDDDNFVTDADFVGWHSDVGKVKNMQLIQSDTGWHNVHEHLKADVKFYPRGYPFGQRHKKTKLSISSERVRAVVNQGLVLGDPDIDAIQRLAHPIEATSMNADFEPQFGLKDTWSPFNYQNTCLCRELIPCYFRPKSGLRNADIWTAYIINKLAGHMGDVITFGQPLVRQVRNEHNLFDDLDIELQNNRETDYFCDLLRSVSLSGTTYFKSLNELLSKVEVDDKHPMSKSFIKEYRTWCEVVAQYV